MTSDYTRQTVVSQDKNEAYNIILNLGQWWGDADGQIKEEGDKVSVTFEASKETIWTFEAKKLIPGEFIELTCVHANHVHDGQPESIRKEWEGTSLVWQLRQEKHGTVIDFTHVGLNENLACYSVCEPGWDHFLVDGIGEHLNIQRESISA